MINDLITYIIANTTSFVAVEYAIDMEPLEDLESETPAIFIWPGSETAEASGYDNVIRQYVSKTVELFIVAPNADIETLKTELRVAILGWQATQYYDPLELINGQPQEIKAGFVWWRETYRTAVHISN